MSIADANVIVGRGDGRSLAVLMFAFVDSVVRVIAIVEDCFVIVNIVFDLF